MIQYAKRINAFRLRLSIKGQGVVKRQNLIFQILKGLEWCSKGSNVVYILSLVKRVYY